MLTPDLFTPDLIVLLGFGILTGVTTVLFGFGGGFITVPVLAAVLGGPAPGDGMHVAVATSAAVMVINAGGATLGQARAGALRRDLLWPLAGTVALGALLGALTATITPGPALRWLFAGYLVLTILDSVLRRGFLTRDPAEPRPLTPAVTGIGGVGIGFVASLLGVGGSVLTVPLLRRSGHRMATAVAHANPLSLPVAVVATAVYLCAPSGWGDSGVAAGGGALRIGLIDVGAALSLLAASLPTIALVRRLGARIPDRAHAIAYLGLLGAALAAVVVVG
ncbi:sulfite exporter TauE/SafE family protein [Leucobacter sp. M11]|nr:sulfite exporter TauE/SafE family protein [Leucobacter sp. M11]